MSFGENLQFLRKRDNITQEQLAEKLNVSRQSVSKWESEGSFPEMDKLLQMCDMFSCDMDTLMRGNAEESTAKDTSNYDAHMNSRSGWMAGAVGLILFGLGLEGIAGEGYAFMICVTVAVVIFIIKGMQHEAFQNRHPHIKQFYSEDVLYRFEKRFPILVAVPVAMILLDVTCYDLIAGLIAKAGLSEGWSDTIFFWVLGLAIVALVYGGMQKEKYNIKAYNDENREKDSATQKKIGKWCGAIMLIATALFLLSLSIPMMDYMSAKEAGSAFSWKNSIVAVSWLVFPVGGILCGVVSVLFSKAEKEKSDTVE